MPLQGTGWRNVEYRSYHFVDEEGDNASVEETTVSRDRRRGSEIPLTETEQLKLKESVKESYEAGELHLLQSKA